MQQYIKNTWPLIVIGVIAGVGIFVGEVFVDIFAFKKSIVLDFPFYRLMTGHFTHANLHHYLLNMGGLIVIALLFYEYLNAKNQCILFVVGSIGISLIMVIVYEKETYVGLSAYLHFLFAWAVIIDLQSKRISSYLLFGGLIAKIVYELGFYQKGTTEALIGIDVAVESHAIGAGLGIIVGLIYLWYEREQKAAIVSK